ncbi:DNA polymerase subunit Cdc27 [Ophiocordyceps camponoti-floridani]|uniref:DNA polymerase delta subunit 3 n=1 Tax=Ophiocordyceps camponoti-floridani TaxID=2030778 RepID=A0A8H4VBY4_9HYPO|nr:DNA polymerase subunit Cdc27 [Ophiocordyceps camponoti-floridani]
MDEAQKFLADRLLSQERPITYRELSRALNLHVNIAKGLLFEFYERQNALRAGSIYATYLLAGVKASKAPQGDADVGLSSSAPEPPTEPLPIKTVALVGENRLQDLLREFSEVTSIHIYSLAVSRIKDVAILAEIANSLPEASKDEESSETSKYGAIPNPLVRRRRDPRGKPAPKPVGNASKPALQGKASQVEKGQVVKTEKNDSKDADLLRRSSSASTSKLSQGKKPTEKSQPMKSEKLSPAETPAKASAPAPAPKRSSSGSIMQSFAKAAAKPPRQPKKVKQEEAPATMSDDGEADDSDILPPSKRKCGADTDAATRSRKDRADELKRMMEEDDEDDEQDVKESQADQDEEMQDVADTEPKKDQSPAEEVTSSSNGRRRGRRRVMKKKRILDDEGYMVTIQEAGWESFSEEDVAPAPAVVNKGPEKGKKGGAGAKGRGGNIMAFFSKK